MTFGDRLGSGPDGSTGAGARLPDPPEGLSEAMNPERPPGALEDRADEEISGQAETELPPNREDWS